MEQALGTHIPAPLHSRSAPLQQREGAQSQLLLNPTLCSPVLSGWLFPESTAQDYSRLGEMVGIPSPRLHPALSAATYWPRFTGTLVGWSRQEGGSQRKLWTLSPGSTQGSWAKYLSRQLSVKKRPFQSHCLPQVVHSAQDPDAKWVMHKACDLQVSLITQIGKKKTKAKSDPTIPLLHFWVCTQRKWNHDHQEIHIHPCLQRNWSVTRSKMWGKSKCLWKSEMIRNISYPCIM